MRRILITNGDNIRTLMFFRALQGTGLEVHVAAERRFNACFLSRYCRHKLVNVNPKKDKELFIKQLADYCLEKRIDVLVPMNAEELEIILSNKERFDCVIPFADYEKFHRIKDKWEFYKLTQKCKISAPKTYKVTKVEELDRLKIAFPAIVKIRTGAGSKGVQKVNSREELRQAFKSIVKEYKLSPDTYPIIQEYVIGSNMCVAALCKDGKILSISAYRSLRQLPLDHGTSTSRESVKDEKACKDVRKMLEELKWHGIAQFDIIKRGDEYLFLEMNPRFYTSLNVTVKSGLNYPYNVCMLDKGVKLPRDYKAGVICRILMSDTVVFFKSISRERRYPLREFFRMKDTYIDDFSLKDPAPTIALFVKFLRGKLL